MQYNDKNGLKSTSNEQQRKSLTNHPLFQRRKTALALGGLASLLILSVGFEVFSHKETSEPLSVKHEVTQETPMASKVAAKEFKPLKILSDETSDIAMADSDESTNEENLSIIQFLNRQKNLQAKKIHELNDELSQTKARLQQLKNDILIKGDSKEQKLNGRIQELEGQLKEAQSKLKALDAELSSKETLIKQKVGELESLSRVFSETNRKLQEELTIAQQYHLAEQARAQRAQDELDRLQEKHEELIGEAPLHDQDKLRLESELAAAKSMAMELDDLNKKLINEIESLDQKNVAMASGDHLPLIAEIEELHKSLNEQEGNLVQMDKNLSAANNDCNQLKEKVGKLQKDLSEKNTLLSALQQQLAEKVEGKNQPQNSRTLRLAEFDQQQKLIVELEHGLALAEKKNQKLQEMLQKASNGQLSGINLGHDENDTMKELRDRLAKAEAKAKELETTLEFTEGREHAQTIAQLHKELGAHKESLKVAQQELVDLSEEYAYLDDRYGAVNRGLNCEIEDLHGNNQSLHGLLQQARADYENEHDRAVMLEKQLLETIAKADKLEEQVSHASGQLAHVTDSKENNNTRLNATLEHLTASLQREKEKSKRLETKLRDLDRNNNSLLSQNDNKPAPNIQPSKQVDEVKAMYESEKKRADQLAREFELASQDKARLNEELQELKQANSAISNGTGNSNNLKDKVAYLTRRLLQEQSRAQQAEDRLQAIEAKMHEMERK